MAPTHFSLMTVSSEDALITALKALSAGDRPHYVGRTHHWIHAPSLSVDGLTSSGPTMQPWTHLVISKAAALSAAAALSSSTWTISAEVDDGALASLSDANVARSTREAPSLPQGWSPADASGLLAAEVPSDLEASLALASIPLGAPKSSAPQPLKEFVRSFGTQHSGPIAMFNLLAYEPGMRARYFEYVAAFTASVGSNYGGDPVFLGTGVSEWTSRRDEAAEPADAKAGGSGVWEDVALVYYPSLWHFAKMLDDPEYARADRSFKHGALRDNPLICCTEVVLGT